MATGPARDPRRTARPGRAPDGELPGAASLADAERREGRDGRPRLPPPLPPPGPQAPRGPSRGASSRPPRGVRSFSSTCLFRSRSSFQTAKSAEARSGRGGAPRRARARRQEDADEEAGRERDRRAGRVQGGDERPRDEVADETAGPEAPSEELRAPEGEVAERRGEEEDDEEPERLVPQAPSARDRNRATPRARTTRGGTKPRSRRTGGTVGEGGADAPRPVARPDAGSATAEKSDGSAGSYEKSAATRRSPAATTRMPRNSSLRRCGASGCRGFRSSASERPASEDRGAEERAVDDERLELHRDDEAEEGGDGEVADDGGDRHPGE